MEQITNGEKIPKKHLTIEEQLAQLEAQEQKAKAAEEKRKAKMNKLRSAMIAQKREAFDKVLKENSIQTESQLHTVMELYQTLATRGILTKSQLEDVLAEAKQANPNLMKGLLEQKVQIE